MTTQLEAPVFPKGADSWAKEQANALLRLVEDMFHRRNLAALVVGFHRRWHRSLLGAARAARTRPRAAGTRSRHVARCSRGALTAAPFGPILRPICDA